MNQDSRAEAENAVVIGGSLAGLLAARARRLIRERAPLLSAIRLSAIAQRLNATILCHWYVPGRGRHVRSCCRRLGLTTLPKMILRTAVEARGIRQLMERQAIVRKALVSETVKCEAVDLRYRSLTFAAR